MCLSKTAEDNLKVRLNLFNFDLLTLLHKTIAKMNTFNIVQTTSKRTSPHSVVRSNQTKQICQTNEFFKA